MAATGIFTVLSQWEYMHRMKHKVCTILNPAQLSSEVLFRFYHKMVTSSGPWLTMDSETTRGAFVETEVEAITSSTRMLTISVQLDAGWLVAQDSTSTPTVNILSSPQSSLRIGAT
jgi:hypothetical protein